MQGTRRPDGTPESELQPGDFCKIDRRIVPGGADPAGGPQWWAVCPPTWKWPAGMRDDKRTETRGYPGRLNPAVHTVVEHDDGSITVMPSIKQTIGSGTGMPEQEVFHGMLEKGVWRDV